MGAGDGDGDWKKAWSGFVAESVAGSCGVTGEGSVERILVSKLLHSKDPSD